MLNIDDNANYNNVFHKFTYDYDRENPVTKREGFMRLMEKRIKYLEENKNQAHAE